MNSRRGFLKKVVGSAIAYFTFLRFSLARSICGGRREIMSTPRTLPALLRLDRAASRCAGCVRKRVRPRKSFRDPSEAPPLIRAALFSQASGLRSESGIDFPPDLFVDAGDVPVLTGRAMLAAIEDFIAALLDRDLSPLSLGGDHAVTYPIVKAFSRKYRDLTILQFDAHADLYDTFEGNRYSHACPFARIMEEGLVETSCSGWRPDPKRA